MPDWVSVGQGVPAAHHEVGQVDWHPQVRKVLDALALVDER
jgi:hypothetical protein